MKKFSLGDLRKYGPWWARFSSAVAATVCGIVLTLGVGQCNSNRAKENYVRKNEVIAVNSIRRSINQAKSAFEKFEERYDAVKAMTDLYPDSLAYATEDQCWAFCSAFYSIEYVSYDSSAENMFNSNVDVWVNSKSLSAISSINELFSGVDLLLDQVKDINADFDRVGRACLPHAVIDCDDPHQAAAAFFNNSENVFVMTYDIPSRIMIMRSFLGVIDYMYSEVCKNLNITEADLDACNAEIEDVYFGSDAEDSVALDSN